MDSFDESLKRMRAAMSDDDDTISYLEQEVVEEGNTSSSSKKQKLTKKHADKRITAAKRWAGTWNNYPEEGPEQFQTKARLHGIKWIFEFEDEGTPHMQIYAEKEDRFRPFAVWPKDWGIHWEAAKGDRKANVKYCSKDHGRDRTMCFWEPACMKPPRRMVVLADGDMYPWQQSLRGVLRGEPGPRTVYWVFGRDGGEGKTTWAKKMCVEEGAIMLGGKAADVKNGIVTYNKDMGDTPEAIIINVPRSQDMAYVSYQGIEDCKDMCFYSGKYEGGMVCGMPAHVIVLANEPPDESKMSKDRWSVWEIDQNAHVFPWSTSSDRASGSSSGAAACDG